MSRIALLILSAAAIPMAITLSRIERAGRQGFWVALVLSLGVVLENSHRNTEAYNKSRHVVRVERIKQQLALHGTCGAFYVEPAAGSVPLITHLDAMWVSMETQIPTVNGYSGSVPHGWTFEARAAEEDIERYLRTRGAHVEGKVCIVRQAAD
ncbi:MAG: hypothetical protein HY042_11035 [Spirochaetia bacterium]|nr:hypothetical protein [Spirochaetia bacterium]